jgi:tagatose-6-phosphate ketose/aldose isomerase
MNAFAKLLNASPAEKQSRGLEHTPREINQQPNTWRQAAEMLLAKKIQVADFLAAAGLMGGVGNNHAELILTGAGSSEFVGNATAPALQKALHRKVTSIPTTHLVTNPDIFLPDQNYVLLSFARSGNSPESMATWNLAKQLRPDIKQIAITCNKNGALANAAKSDKNALYLELPEQTNDQSLVMTSSFTTMALTALGLGGVANGNNPTHFTTQTNAAANAATNILTNHTDTLQQFANQPFTRACFLGSGPLNGTMQECHLKLQEMTEGQVVSTFNSFVGLRHGPQVFINKQTAVIAALSSNPYVQQYELDMLRELKTKNQGLATLAICTDPVPELPTLATAINNLGQPLDDNFRVLTDTLVGQLLGTFACLRCGLKPDNPSTTGTITRVVQGVKIYPYN